MPSRLSGTGYCWRIAPDKSCHQTPSVHMWVSSLIGQTAPSEAAWRIKTQARRVQTTKSGKHSQFASTIDVWLHDTQIVAGMVGGVPSTSMREQPLQTLSPHAFCWCHIDREDPHSPYMQHPVEHVSVRCRLRLGGPMRTWALCPLCLLSKRCHRAHRQRPSGLHVRKLLPNCHHQLANVSPPSECKEEAFPN